MNSLLHDKRLLSMTRNNPLAIEMSVLLFSLSYIALVALSMFFIVSLHDWRKIPILSFLLEYIDSMKPFSLTLCFHANPWNVDISTCWFFILLFSSLVAFLVNVMAHIARASTPCSIRFSILLERTRVFPDPGPAITN